MKNTLFQSINRSKRKKKRKKTEKRNVSADITRVYDKFLAFFYGNWMSYLINSWVFHDLSPNKNVDRNYNKSKHSFSFLIKTLSFQLSNDLCKVSTGNKCTRLLGHWHDVLSQWTVRPTIVLELHMKLQGSRD